MKGGQKLMAGSSAVWKVGDVISGDYEVTGILGEGGMGTVYKVHSRRSGMDLALKVPRPDIFARANGNEIFLREAQTWVELGWDRHIVNCATVNMLDGIPHIFIEYVDGGSLSDWIRDRRLYHVGAQRALERLLDVAMQVAWGLDYAHVHGVVHQDVKPANVMMETYGTTIGEGHAKVTDFGLAKARRLAGESSLPEAGQSILVSRGGMTPAYCSPEQLANLPLSRRTDIWSWGVSVLEMFVGKVTWGIGTVAPEVLATHQRQDPMIPVMPVEVVRLLQRCFQLQPEQRPATMEEVAEELQAIYARLVGSPYPVEQPNPQQQPPGIRAFSLFELGRLEEALVAVEQAILLQPTKFTHYYLKGIVLAQLGRKEEGLFSLEQAIDLHPPAAEAAEIYQNKGLMLRQLARLEEAEEAYQKARDLRSQLG
jgi:serine/threonine protein kinase